MRPILVLTLLLLATQLGTVHAFRSCSITRRFTVLPRQGGKKPPPPRLPPLFYRDLDDQDADANLLKARSRSPPVGFDLKRQLSNRSLQQQEQENKTAMNVHLIIALFLNQFLILTVGMVLAAAVLFFRGGASAFSLQSLQTVLHWQGGTGAARGVFDFWPTPLRIGQGLLGVLPMLLVSRFIEASDRRAFHNINFSTISMCLTLFGRRRAPPKEFQTPTTTTTATTSWKTALATSAALSAVTGFCEEGVFRRLIPAGARLLWWTPPIGLLLLQAHLFAAGHVQPGGRSHKRENAVLLGLQLFNGLTLGGLYLATGGDIVPCMVAHTVYDTVEFFGTWWRANRQLEYAEEAYEKVLPPPIQEKVKATFATNGVPFDSTKYRRMKRLFYTFDYDRNQTLSRREVRKGLSYLAVERIGTAPPTQAIDECFRRADSDGNERLDFAEFVDLYFLALGRQPKKVPDQ